MLYILNEKLRTSCITCWTYTSGRTAGVSVQMRLPRTWTNGQDRPLYLTAVQSQVGYINTASEDVAGQTLPDEVIQP